MTIVESSDEFKVKISPKRMFKALVTEAHNLLPKIAPHIFKSIDVIDGEGGTAGCTRQLNAPDGAPFAYMKDKIEAVDTENHVVKFVLFEGPALGDKIESIHSEQRFEDSGDGGCVIKSKTKHHLKHGHTHVSEEEINGGKEHANFCYSATEKYLIAHSDVCA